jgi:hypothetical protein
MTMAISWERKGFAPKVRFLGAHPVSTILLRIDWLSCRNRALL